MDKPESIDHYLKMLSEFNSDDAWHSLVEAGPSALAWLVEAFPSIQDHATRAAIVRIVGQYRSNAALSFFVELLNDSHPETWKAALDGIVTIGGESATKALNAWQIDTTPDKRAWRDEALSQIAQELSVSPLADSSDGRSKFR